MPILAANTVDELERLTTSEVSDGTYIFVGGYHDRGDGGGGTFVLNMSSGATEDQGFVFVANNSLGVDARWLRLDMGLGFISVKWFGAKGDGIQDDLPAFRTAIKALEPIPEPPGNHKSRGGAIVVPRSYPHYLLRGNLEINRAIRLYGELGNTRTPATTLLFENFEAEIITQTDPETGEKRDVEVKTPLPAGIVIKPPRNDKDRLRGGSAILQDLYIIGSEGNEANGIHMKSSITLERVRVRKFGGHGVFIDGRGNQGDLRNCNLWRIHDCHFENNGKCGLYIDGAETNAGLSVGLGVEANGEWGILDSTFLGSTHIAPFADSNAAGAYKNGSARAGTDIATPSAAKDALSETKGRVGKSTWINPYVEGASYVELFDLTVIIGGIGGIDPIIKDNPFYSLPANGPILEVPDGIEAVSDSGVGRVQRDITLEEWNSDLCVEGNWLDVYDPTSNTPRNIARFTIESTDRPQITLSGFALDWRQIRAGDAFAPRGRPKPSSFREIERVGEVDDETGTLDIRPARWSNILFVEGNRLDIYPDRSSNTPSNIGLLTIESAHRPQITLSGTTRDLEEIREGNFVAPLGVPDNGWFGRIGRQLALRLGHRTLVTGFLATDLLGSEKLKVAVAHGDDKVLRMQRTGDGHEYAIKAKDGHYWLVPDNYIPNAILEWGTAHAAPNRQNTLRFPKGFYLGGHENPSRFFMLRSSNSDLDPSTGRPRVSGEQVGDRAYLQNPTPGGPLGWIWVETSPRSGIYEWKVLGTVEV